MHQLQQLFVVVLLIVALRENTQYRVSDYQALALYKIGRIEISYFKSLKHRILFFNLQILNEGLSYIRFPKISKTQHPLLSKWLSPLRSGRFQA
jgi:hypothetical protein